METAHHAELIYDKSVKTTQVDLGECEKLDRFFEKFGIDDARDLVQRAHSRPTETDTLAIIIRTDFITLEAQNALLKVLEEPPSSTKFVFVVSDDFSMIPTLRSRFNLSEVLTEKDGKNEEFESFLNSSYQERLSKIETAIKSKDLDWQKSIKKGLLTHVSESRLESETLSGLEFAARTLLTRGASNKMLLEHAALLLGTRL